MVKDNSYDVGAYITNPNQNHGSENIPYKFQLFDEAGNVVAERSGLMYILPNQSKYIVENRLYSQTPVSRAEFIVGQTIDWQSLKEGFETPNLFIEDKRIYNINNQVGFDRVSGVVHNTSNYDLDLITVDVIIANENNEILAMGNTEIGTILADEQRYFLVYWNKIIIGNVGNIIIEAETNLFDTDNFMKQWGTPGELKR
jgi:hypothetical protein